MQFMQVEGVDAFLSPYYQELVCRYGYGGQKLPYPQPKPKGILGYCFCSTPGPPRVTG